MKKILTIILFLVGLMAYSQDANYYVSMSDGDDGNSGLTPAQAWKTISRADNNTYQADDTIFFNRGDKWKENWPNPLGDGTEGHNIVITAYGSGPKPIISARDTVDGWSDPGQWTRPWEVTRPNVWYNAETRTPLYWTAIRMWFDGVEKERPQTFPPTADKPWYWSGDDSLFVYSTSNPATAFDSIEKATSYYAGIEFDADNYWTVSYMEFEHFYICIEIDDSDGIIVDSCDIKGFYGINIYASVDSRDGEIKNCNFDTENTFVSDWEAKYTGDGIKISGVANTWYIHDNYFKNWNHTSITLEDTNGDRIDSVYVYDNELTAPDVDYGGQLAVLYEYGRGNEIYRNYIHNIQVRNQIQGENLKFYYNIIDTVNAPSHYPKDVNAGGGIWNAGLTGGTAHNMKFYNNVIAHCEDYGIGLIHGGSYNDKYDNEYINNIIYACDDTAIYISGGATVLDNTFKNNIVYTSGVTNSIYYKGAPNISVATWDISDTGGDVISGNISTAPTFISGTLQPDVSSPAINAGLDLLLTTDYSGNPIVGMPDIGAYEYQFPVLPSSGLGFDPKLYKENVKDTMNIAKSLRLKGIPVLATAPELNQLNGFTGTTPQLNHVTNLFVAGDTTVTPIIGRIVFQASDTSFYGCRSTKAPKKWYKLNE